MIKVKQLKLWIFAQFLINGVHERLGAQERLIGADEDRLAAGNPRAESRRQPTRSQRS